MTVTIKGITYRLSSYTVVGIRGKMKLSSRILIFIILIVVCVKGNITHTVNPPHCTQVTKSADYEAQYNFDYPTVYIPPGQSEAYQHLFCINPPSVNYVGTTVCDWAAAPQVEFIFRDEFMHVIRKDPTGQYLGNAVIKTIQRCGHKNMYNIETSPIGLKQTW